MIQSVDWIPINRELFDIHDPNIFYGKMRDIDLRDRGTVNASRLTETINFGCESGVYLIGQGSIYDIRWLGHFGRFTAIGADNLDTLFDFSGTSIVQIRDVSLFGRIAGNQRAKRIIKTNWVNGYGASDFKFENVKLFDADIGIEAGNDGDLMCDFIHCYRTDFITCKSGFRSNNNQSLCHRFELCGAENCDVIYDITKGGDLTVEGGGCTNCSMILKAGGGGDNAAGITINNYRPEGPARFDIGQYRKVDINNLWMSDANPEFDLNVGVDATVTVRGGYLRGMKDKCIRVEAGGLVILDNVLMPGFKAASLKLEKGAAVIVRECQKAWGNSLHQNYTYKG